MDKVPLVSIIVPVYNVEKYLEKCITSIINQSYKNIEIIVVNDGSKDHSLSIVQRFCEIDNRIILINKVNGGLASARNTGVSIAKGDYIWHIDSDDYVENCLEKMVKEVVDNDSDIIVTGYYCEDEEYIIRDVKTSRYDGITLGKEALGLMLTGVIGGEVWTKLYRRKLYTQYQIKQDENFSEAEDVMLNFHLFSVANSVLFSRILSVHHIFRAGSYSDSSKTIKFRGKHFLGISTLNKYAIDPSIKLALNEYISCDFLSLMKLRNKTLLIDLNLLDPKIIYTHLSNIHHFYGKGLFKRIFIKSCNIPLCNAIFSYLIYFYFFFLKK